MNGSHHAMPREQFIALARGRADLGAIHQLVAAQYSKHLILVGAVGEMAKAERRPDDDIALAGYELLDRVRGRVPAAVEEVISHPSVGAWAWATIRGGEGARPSGLAAVAAAAAIKAGLDVEIEVPVINGSVTLPSLGTAQAAGDTAVIRTGAAQVHSAGLVVQARPGQPGWRELRRVAVGDRTILIDDLDPFRLSAPECEQTGRLDAARLADFTAVLRRAWAVLSPARAREISAIVRVIVPFQAPDPGYASTSSPQAFGALGMSCQRDPYACGETLVHETQHLKLSALLDLVELTEPDDGRRYYAPWRPDPRPASGLLQGAYAFFGVSGFWREQRAMAPGPRIRQRAESEFAHWREGAALTAKTLLSCGRLTTAGTDFVGEMTEVLEAWCREPVSEDALARAHRKADRHRAQWQSDNGQAGQEQLSAG
jgi:HEXXH motif-containing protein